MALDFAKLKKASGKASLEKLTTELQKIGQKQTQGGQDDRFWKPTVDKAENGYAVLRFLPAHSEDNDTPFIRLWDHGFQGPSGSWYFENSLTTIGKQDPVSEYNSKLWNSGSEADKELARKYKRRLHFLARVYIVTDQGNPDNEGKIFYWKFGKKIFQKLEEAMNPEFADEDPMNPFDLWEGADFKLKIRKVEGYRNYDKSEFAKPGALANDDTMASIMEQAEAYPLLTFLAPSQFKPYDELKAKFEKVLGLDGSAPNHSKAEDLEEEQEEYVAPKAAKSKPAKATPAPFDVDEDEDDETKKFFDSLNED
jgi:hypothetical protein